METTYALNENETLQEIKRPPRIGFIKTFAGTTPPEGTLLCDGSAVSRNTYSELFAAIGTTWGSGDGTTTFNLPDLRDVWILCAGTEHEAGESVAEGLPNALGRFMFADDRKMVAVFANVTLSDGNNVFYGENNQTPMYQIPNSMPVQETVTNRWDTIQFSLQKANPIYGASDRVTPASVAVLPCIVYE